MGEAAASFAVIVLSPHALSMVRNQE